MTNAIDIQTDGKMLLVKATGKLTKEAYQEFVPLVEQMVHQHGKVRILFAMHDFHGWEAGALWEDQSVVVDRHFVSSRKPDDLPDFCRAILRVLTSY